MFLRKGMVIASVLCLLTKGMAVYFSSMYMSSMYFTVKKTPLEPNIDDPEYQRSLGLEKKKPKDKSLWWDEFVFGILNKRQFLLENAKVSTRYFLFKGKVLEVCAGQGNNLGYYKNDKTESILLTDIDPSEIKLSRLSKAKSMQVDVSAIPFPDATFDTVVDTFGLCSCDDPVLALKEMRRVTKPDGRILLLEHGRASYNWLNELLDKSAKNHAINWGCWWNRNIHKLVVDADLEILEYRRYHFGTTYYIIARPCNQGEAASK